MRSMVLASLALGLAAGCNDNFNQPPPPTGSLKQTQSFTVRGALNADLSTASVDFVLRVDPVGATMLVGPAGFAMSVPIVQDGDSFIAQAPVQLPIPNAFCGSKAVFSDFRFTGGRDAISGVATGTGEVRLGDTGFEKSAHLDFKGVADVTPPLMIDDSGVVDPLGDLVLTTSEPLPPGTKAQLLLGNVSIDLRSLTDDPDATTQFQTPPGALRYDATYSIVVKPWTDLAGNTGAPIKGVSTSPAPALIPGDGFETAEPGVLAGVTIVDATTFPPISGQKSALVGDGRFALLYPVPSRFTARLAVAPGNSRARFSLRPFSVNGSVSPSVYGTRARLAVPGGEIVEFDLADVRDSGTDQVTPSGMHVTLGQTHVFEALLPAGVSDEVVFDLVTGLNSNPCYTPVPIASYELDDLRVE